MTYGNFCWFDVYMGMYINSIVYIIAKLLPNTIETFPVCDQTFSPEEKIKCEKRNIIYLPICLARGIRRMRQRRVRQQIVEIVDIICMSNVILYVYMYTAYLCSIEEQRQRHIRQNRQERVWATALLQQKNNVWMNEFAFESLLQNCDIICTLVRLNYIHTRIYRFAHANNTYLLSYHVRVCIYKIYIGIIEDILCQRFKQRTKRIMLRARTEHHVQHIGVAIEREP